MNLDKTYIDFIKQLKQKIQIAKNRATLSVNRAMIELYFNIGKDIVVKRSGYSIQNLWYMRQFYNTYKEKSNLQQLVGEIPWGQKFDK